jgi:hypothetical protein
MIFKQFDVQCAIRWPTLMKIVATSFITKIEIIANNYMGSCSKKSPLLMPGAT